MTRNLKVGILIIVLLVIVSYFYLSFKPIEQEGFEIEILAENLEVPWAIDFLPDGRMIFTERGGRVSILDDELRVVGNIDVNQNSESGLHGIAVDPEFDKNKYIYLYYTHDLGNRVSRFILNDQLEDEFILLDNIPSARFHDGGKIKFGPDGMLYITTGDATKPSSAQDINSLAGKILRMNKDGSMPEDNPFGNYVYSYGHRNSQGITWNLQGELYSSEHGPTKNDEVNLIIKGGNYGWPIECTTSGEHINPIRCFSEFTLAPAGIAFYNNDLYVTGLRGTQLRRLVFDGTGKIIDEQALFRDLGRIREVVEYKGYLYIATSNKDGRGVPRINDDKIVRVTMK